MNYLPMKLLLEDALANNYAVPSFCVWNAETMKTVLTVAEKLESPVILMNGPVEFQLLTPALMGKCARVAAEDYFVRAALHLDHGGGIQEVKDCIKAGYSSVMLDFSTKPFAENAAALIEVCGMAHPLGITVEGEIGAVGKIDNITGEGGRSSTLTEPAEAEEYVRMTGVDALAVSIGNAHGNYTALPKFDFDRLKKIHERCQIPLVLHGGSGTPEEDIKKTVSLGIAKINVASELVRAVRDTLKNFWDEDKMLWVPEASAEAMSAMSKIVEKWILRSGSAGKIKFKKG